MPWHKRLYSAVDAAHKESCRPDFAVVVYPGHLSLAAAEWDVKQGTAKVRLPALGHADRELGLNPDLQIADRTPPTFFTVERG